MTIDIHDRARFPGPLFWNKKKVETSLDLFSSARPKSSGKSAKEIQFFGRGSYQEKNLKLYTN